MSGQAVLGESLLHEMGEYSVGETVDVEGEDGWEYGAVVVGPASEGGDKSELRVRFRDGAEDNWPVEDFRRAVPNTNVDLEQSTDTRIAMIRKMEARPRGKEFDADSVTAVLAGPSCCHCDLQSFAGQRTRTNIIRSLKSKGCPPMVLVALSDLKAHGRIPEFGEGVATPALELLDRFGNDGYWSPLGSDMSASARLVTVMCTHRWQRPWWPGPCANGCCGCCEATCGRPPTTSNGAGKMCGHPDNEGSEKFKSLVAFGDWCLLWLPDKRISSRPSEVAFWCEFTHLIRTSGSITSSPYRADHVTRVGEQDRLLVHGLRRPRSCHHGSSSVF